MLLRLVGSVTAYLVIVRLLVTKLVYEGWLYTALGILTSYVIMQTALFIKWNREFWRGVHADDDRLE